jgi:PAS domain S-box-containing protein
MKLRVDMKVKKTILLVDDDVLIALAEQRLIEKSGYQVIYASSGEMALELVLTKETPIDLILMDIDLGKSMDGIETASKILEHKDIPLVFLSSHTEKSYTERTEQITSYGYITKNAGETVLLASIKMAFKLHEANSALKESEERFRLLAENAQDIIYRIELFPEWKFSYVSPSSTNICGYTPEEHYSDPDLGLKLVHPDDRIIIDQLPISDEPFATPLTIRWQKKSGTIIWVEQNNVPVYDSKGNLIALEGIARDITERKRLEQQYQESETKYRTFVDHLPGIAYSFSTTRGGLFWAKPIEEILGYSPQELQANPLIWNDSIHPEDKPMVQQAIRDNAAGTEYSIEYRIQTKDGRWIWLYDRFIHKTILEHETIIHGLAIDVTEQNTTKQLLESNTKFLNDLLDNNLDLVSLTDMEGNLTYVSRSHESLGYTNTDLLNKNVISLVHPEDQAHIIERFKLFLKTEQPTSIEYRWKQADSSYVWLETTGKMIKDPQGQRVNILYNSRDITARKAKEELNGYLTLVGRRLNELTLESINYEELVDTALEISGATYGIFNTYNPQSQTLTTHAFAGISKRLEQLVNLLGFSPIGKTWKPGTELQNRMNERTTHHYQSLQQYAQGYVPKQVLKIIEKTFSVTSIISVMIRYGDKTVGNFNLFYTANSSGKKGSNDLWFNQINHSSQFNQQQDTRIKPLELYGEIVAMVLTRVETEQKNQLLIQEKETLLREVQHRIKNTLATMGGLLSLQASSLTDPIALATVQEIQSRFTGLEVLYSQLYLSTNQSSGLVEEYVTNLIYRLLDLYPNPVHLSLDLSLGDLILESKRLSALGLILNELVTNSFKYGIVTTDKQATISLRCTMDTSTFSFTYADSGPGYPSNILKSIKKAAEENTTIWKSPELSSLGITIILSLAKQLQANIDFIPGPGAQVRISFLVR